jgi:lysyl-tRNA synthetase class 2
VTRDSNNPPDNREAGKDSAATLSDTNQVIEERRQKLKALRAQGNPYPNDVPRKDLAAELTERYEKTERDALDLNPVVV